MANRSARDARASILATSFAPEFMIRLGPDPEMGMTKLSSLEERR
jgi:hypothetical protein